MGTVGDEVELQAAAALHRHARRDGVVVARHRLRHVRRAPARRVGRAGLQLQTGCIGEKNWSALRVTIVEGC